MQLTAALAALLIALPLTLSAPTAAPIRNDEPPMCGYVLTEKNSGAFAGISAYSSCTAIYYNQTIPGYQDAFAYSIFGGCRCTFHRSEEECMGDSHAQMYQGPIGEIGKEPYFNEPKPKWYNCGTMGL